MKSIKTTRLVPPSTLPLHEHNARRRRGSVVTTPGSKNQSHKSPHEPETRSTKDAAVLLETYSQFAPQGPLHQ